MLRGTAGLLRPQRSCLLQQNRSRGPAARPVQHRKLHRVVALRQSGRPGLDSQLRRARRATQRRWQQLQEQIRLSPPVSAIRSVMAALWSVLRPYHAAATAQSDQLLYSYREFLSEEVKRKWEWKRRTEQERGFWDAVVTFAMVCGVTLIWEALVPAAVAWAIAVPLYFVLTSYELSFRGLLLNPIMVGLVLMLPLKFYPGMPVRWV